jgi:hypothetical protein
MKETQNIIGRLHIRVFNRKGEVAEEVRAYNRITVAGKTMLAKLFVGDKATDPVSYFGVGAGAGAEEGLGKAIRIQEGQFRKVLYPPLIITEDERVRLILTGELDFNEPYGIGEKEVELSEAGLFNTSGLITEGGKATPHIGTGPILVAPIQTGGGAFPISVPGSGRSGSRSGSAIRGQNSQIGSVAPVALSTTGTRAKNPFITSPSSEQPGGGMYNLVTFKPIIKTNQFKLQFNWEIIF